MKRHENKRVAAERSNDPDMHAEEATNTVQPFVLQDVRYAPYGERTYLDVHIVGVATLKLVSMIFRGERVVFASCLIKSDGLRWHGIEDIDDAFARAVLLALDAFERREKASGVA